jgi:hypothetical protein
MEMTGTYPHDRNTFPKFIITFILVMVLTIHAWLVVRTVNCFLIYPHPHFLIPELLHIITIWLVRQAGFATTELIGGLVPSEEAGVSAIQSIWVTFQLFCGFLIRRTAIPDGWIWMHYLSSFKYPIGNFTFAFQAAVGVLILTSARVCHE